MTVERIDIVITEKGGKTVTRTIDDIAESASKASTQLTTFQKTAIGVAGFVGTAIGTMGTILYKGFSNAAKGIKETASAAKQLSIGVENFSRLDFAARSYDMTTKDLTASMASLQRQQIAAAKPNSEMNKLFRQMGVSAVDTTGKLRNTEDVLRDVSDLFQKMPDGVNKTALATRLFGDSGASMVSMLNDGSNGLDEMAKKADDVGYTLSEQTAKDVKAFYDELDEARLQIEAMFRQALPGLLPMLREFSGLLNSQEFKDGFNAIVQGAGQAILWLTNLASTVANVTKYIAESTAAMIHGADAKDTVRVQGEIDRLESAQKALQAVNDKGIGAYLTKDFWSGILDVPVDALIKPVDKALADVQGQLDQSKNKLQVGMELNVQDAAAAQAAALAAAQGKPPASGNAPAIDWTQLGLTPKGPKGPDQEKALQRLQRELANTVGSINPVLAAERELARAQDVFNRAMDKGLISQEKANDYMALYRDQLRDQLHPLEAVTERLQEQTRLAGLLNEERDVESRLLSITEQLKRQGIRTTEEENAALREQLKLLQETDKLAAAKEGFLGQSRGKRDEQFGIDAKALGELTKSGEVGGADQFNILNQMLGGTLENSQAAFDAQLAQFQEYQDRVKILQQQGVLDAQQASDAIKAIKRAELDTNLQRTEQALGAASGLMQSNSKEAFRIGQAAAIGQAIVSTYTAATNAYQSAAAIPYVGWILGPAAAAGAIAAGMAQVSAIRSQQMPAYRTGGTYTVGGMGGTDSQTVAFRATPGEQVSINTPAQARAMERMAEVAERGGRDSGTTVNQNVTIVQQGKPDRRTSAQQARDMRKATERQYQRSV